MSGSGRDRLRVAMVAPPFVRIPPDGYGGTELVVAELARELAADGHEVRLYATGDSHVAGCRTAWLFPRPLWPPEPMAEWNQAVFAAQDLERWGADVVHAHLPGMVALAPLVSAPMVVTVHHGPTPEHERLYRTQPDPLFVCISARQAQLMGDGLRRPPAVIHHGIDPRAYAPGRGDGGYALFIGRLDACKAPHLAIIAAREAGLPLLVAGKPHEGDYFSTVLAAELARGGARLIGEVGGDGKRRVLREAAVLVFPIQWEEPFGLVLIEAMFCGTPVVALRKGSVPEIIDEGVTGFVVDDARELAPRMRDALRLDRRRVRARAVERFASARMAGEYAAVYRDALALGRIGGRAEPGLAHTSR